MTKLSTISNQIYYIGDELDRTKIRYIITFVR